MEKVLLVIFGFSLGFLADWLKRRRMRKAHWKMIGAEVSICAERAKWYLNRTVSAPLYRMPVSAFRVSFPILVSEADLSPREFSSLIEYYAWAEDINRGLENAADAQKVSDTPRLQKEEARLQSKCEKLLSQYLEPVAKTLESHGASPNNSLKPTAN